MATVAERVASLALNVFDSLPAKCKPRIHPHGGREWTVLSAVVLVTGEPPQSLTCASLATGTKCLPASALANCHGSVLHDSHAEVLALRGWNYWLLAEMHTMLDDPTYQSPFLEPTGDPESAQATPVPRPPFRLKPDAALHFFTTEAPCGDASMELLVATLPDAASEPWPVDDRLLANGLHGRGHFSLLGHVRRKPSRADAEPSLSKSCTDKLAVTQFTSTLSFPADLLVEQTRQVYTRRLVVYETQFHATGYQRAFGPAGRLSAVRDAGHFFDVAVLPATFPAFPFAKPAATSSGLAEHKAKASNLSMLYVSRPRTPGGGILEVLVNGVKQGWKQWDQRPKKSSVVSRKRMWQLASSLIDLAHDQQSSPPPSSVPVPIDLMWAEETRHALQAETYGRAKRASRRTGYRDGKQRVTDAMGNWVRNRGDDDWTVHEPRPPS